MLLSRIRAVVVTALLCLAVPLALQAQVPNRIGEYEVIDASYHKFVLPGESSITVTVISSAGSSGLYQVGRGMDLGRFLALTGTSISTPSSRESVTTTLRLFRGAGPRTPIYEAKLEEFLASTTEYPELQDGDLFVVESKTKARFEWRDAFTIITGVAALTLAIDRISSATR